jgi:hypothetical protein
MTDEGVRLVSRFALLILLILVGAAVRTMIGPSRQRARIMAVGQIAGIAAGIVLASPISRWAGVDVSAIAACIGMVAGWGVSWSYARRIPREA